VGDRPSISLTPVKATGAAVVWGKVGINSSATVAASSNRVIGTELILREIRKCVRLMRELTIHCTAWPAAADVDVNGS
jgi:hypothetical protein